MVCVLEGRGRSKNSSRRCCGNSDNHGGGDEVNWTMMIIDRSSENSGQIQLGEFRNAYADVLSVWCE